MLQLDEEGPMLQLIELLTQMWLARGGGAHANDKGFDFGGTDQQEPNLARDLTCRQLTDRIKITTLGAPIR